MIRVRVFSRSEENVAIHEANFVKSKRYRVAKECEIVGGPSLYFILHCAVLYGTNDTLCTDCTDSDVHYFIRTEIERPLSRPLIKQKINITTHLLSSNVHLYNEMLHTPSRKRRESCVAGG